MTLAKAGAAVATVAAFFAASTAHLSAERVDKVERATAQFLVELEGIELREYSDVAGYATCGVGHLKQPGERCPSTLPEAMKLLAVDQKNSSLYRGVTSKTVCKTVSRGTGVHLQCRVWPVEDINGKVATGRGVSRLRAGRDEPI
jgi:hypothetical protein